MEVKDLWLIFLSVTSNARCSTPTTRNLFQGYERFSQSSGTDQRSWIELRETMDHCSLSVRPEQLTTVSCKVYLNSRAGIHSCSEIELSYIQLSVWRQSSTPHCSWCRELTLHLYCSLSIRTSSFSFCGPKTSVNSWYFHKFFCIKVLWPSMSTSCKSTGSFIVTWCSAQCCSVNLDILVILFHGGRYTIRF